MDLLSKAMIVVLQLQDMAVLVEHVSPYDLEADSSLSNEGSLSFFPLFLGVLLGVE